MKKHFALILLVLATTVGTAGCASNWWQNFQANPAAAVQAFEQSAQVALNIASATYASVAVFLPANVLAQVQPRYNQAVIAANAALAALSDAVQVAIDAKNPSPDFTALMQAVTDAVQQIETIINDIKNPPPSAPAAAPAAPQGLAELHQAIATMKHVGHTK